MNIEMLGVNYVKTAIAKTDYLVPHINDNDKEPSWDGDIEVYRKSGNVHAKSDLILKVPVQVKGHVSENLKKKNISYPVEYGNIDPQNDGIYGSAQMQELMDYIARHRESLMQLMNDEQKELFDRFMDNRNEYDSLAEASAFEHGFRLGALLMIQVLHCKN